jgi:hypothetical protein
MKWLNDARVTIFHQGDLKTHSHARFRVRDEWAAAPVLREAKPADGSNRRPPPCQGGEASPRQAVGVPCLQLGPRVAESMATTKRNAPWKRQAFKGLFRVQRTSRAPPGGVLYTGISTPET